MNSGSEKARGFFILKIFPMEKEDLLTLNQKKPLDILGYRFLQANSCYQEKCGKLYKSGYLQNKLEQLQQNDSGINLKHSGDALLVPIN